MSCSVQNLEMQNDAEMVIHRARHTKLQEEGISIECRANKKQQQHETAFLALR